MSPPGCGRRVPGSRPGCSCCWSAGFRSSRGFVPLVLVGLVVVRVRLVVVGVSLAVGRVVLVAGLLVFKALKGVLVPRVLVLLGELSMRGFLALVFTAVALVVVLRVRKRVRIVWSVLVLLSAAFCCSCFRAAPPRRLVPCKAQLSASRSWP